MTTTSTAPVDEAPADGIPTGRAALSRWQRMTRFGPVAAVRRVWRRLISMRTALVLLFLLAVASVPGSLLPQRALNPTRTANYITAHGAWGKFLDRIDAFAVFSSPWFAAIYLLLFISLVGCIVPRVRLHLRALRAKPLPAPRNLARLPESDRFEVTDERGPAELADAVRSALGRRWRTVIRTEPSGAVAVSAEKGYTRESGNVLFHIALIAVLICIAVGNLWGYQGTILVTEGRGFCNTVLSYDAFKAGRFAQSGQVAPFCVDNLDKFTASYLADGAPSQFQADITYSRGANGTPEQYKLKVNSPLRLEGDRLYLLSHGYSVQLTVTRPNGEVRTVQSAFVPQDANLSSEGALKLQYGGPDASGKHTDDIGIEGLLAPDAQDTAGVITSISPQLLNPVLAAIVYTGDLGLTQGAAQSVYSLDPTAKADGDLKQVAMKNLAVGDTMALPDGTQVTFDKVLPWASMQVSHDPAQKYLLIAVIALVAGLIGSLAVRRRRVWVRISPLSVAADPASPPPPGSPSPLAESISAPRTVVSVGGLARSDAGNFPDEFSALVARLRSALDAAVRKE
jgi:cytochrome c biogenesis protein